MKLESFPSPDFISEDVEKPKATVSFLFVDHSPGNEAEIVRQIASSDADIVLQELVGSPEEVRCRVEVMINSAIAAKSLEERSVFARGLTQGFRDLVWALAGSGKEFYFIDAASDTPTYDLRQKARAAYGTPEYDRLFAESISAREAIVKRQINEKRELHRGSNILVVMGAIHYEVANSLSDADNISYIDPSLEDLARARRDRLTIA